MMLTNKINKNKKMSKMLFNNKMLKFKLKRLERIKMISKTIKKKIMRIILKTKKKSENLPI